MLEGQRAPVASAEAAEAAGGAAGWTAAAACAAADPAGRDGPEAVSTTHRTHSRIAANAHIAPVNSRFIRRQSANSNGFIIGLLPGVGAGGHRSEA